MTDPLDNLNAALRDRYAIDREIGSGGMARVYLATDLKHHRQVAIKVLRPELAVALGHERFLTEIRTTAGLHHPHILQLHDSGDAGGSLYYVMPFVEGESLRERMDRERPIAIDDALHIAGEVADALAYAHGQGVIHRDIKPENILLSHGHAYVADFGIARAVNAAGGVRLTQTGSALGTPAYMSPEQFGGEEGVDSRSDLYSLGCMLYEMIAGEPPFAGDSPHAILKQRLTQEPPRIRSKRPQVPVTVDEAVHKALSTEPGDRFPSVANFIAALGGGDSGSSPTVAMDVAVEPSARTARDRSIAVLPFENMSPDPDDEYFSDGMTEEIINALAQLEGLHVAARTSCFAFKGKHEDLRIVGEKLGVNTVLEGSVRKAGLRLRITAQLINVADGYHFWSERYDREMTDVFAIQDEIAKAIADKLRIDLTPQDTEATERGGPKNLEAYELFLKGRVLQMRRGRSIMESLACFERAVELDPELAVARAWLADSYRLIGLYGMKPAAEIMPKARAAAEEALAEDPGQVEGLATLACIVSVYDWDLPRALDIWDRALAINPSHVRALSERALNLCLLPGGDRVRALASGRKAIELDPLNAWAAGMYAIMLGFDGQSREAVAQARHAVELDPENFMARWSLVEALILAGDHEEGLVAAEPALSMSGRHPYILTSVAGAYAAQGNQDAANAVYQELQSRSRSGFVGPAFLAGAAASAGRPDEAFELIRRAVAERDVILVYWRAFVGWMVLRGDPKIAKTLTDAGL